MVQIFDMSPTPSSASMLGEALGTGASKRLGLADAQKSFQQAQGNPLKLATAMARLISTSPELARGAGPMYQAMLSQMQGENMRVNDEKGAPFPYPTTDNLPESSGTPSITRPEDVQAQIEGFIPPTYQQIINEAAKMYEENPARYAGNPDNAINYVNQKYAQLEKITQAHKTRHQNLNAIQDNVVERLRTQAKDLGANIPARVMSEIEEKAIQSVKEGKTEQQAMKKYGKEIDEISRKYQQIKDIGAHGLLTNNKESIASLKSLQKDFKKRDDLRNFADSIASDLKVSYPVAYAIADPITDYPQINNLIKDLPSVGILNPGDAIRKTEKIVPKLAKLVVENKASPQSVFYSMRERGYDPLILKDYLDRNRDQLGLSAYQADQLGKEVSPTIPFLNDAWISIWGGLD